MFQTIYALTTQFTKVNSWSLDTFMWYPITMDIRCVWHRREHRLHRRWGLSVHSVDIHDCAHITMIPYFYFLCQIQHLNKSKEHNLQQGSNPKTAYQHTNIDLPLRNILLYNNVQSIILSWFYYISNQTKYLESLNLCQDHFQHLHCQARMLEWVDLWQLL